MNITKKIVYLSLALLVPIFLIFLFSVFARTQHKLPVYFAYDSIKTDREYIITDAHKIPDFKLTDQDGVIFESKSFDSYFKVYDFVFTRCESICPKMTSQMVRVQEAFKDDKDVVLLSLTVDPEYDSPEILKSYSKTYNATPGKWYFLTGEKDSIYTLGQKQFFLTAKQNEEDLTDFLHSERMVLVDKHGWIRGYYNGTDEFEVDRLIIELKVLKKIEEDAKK